MFCFRKMLMISLVGLSLMPVAHAEIDAVKGRRYTLTKQHGPWMIMVASIRDVEDPDRRLKDGMSAWDAADQLVYQLRLKGIPAYTFVREKQYSDAGDELSSSLDSRRYVAQQGYISVLACNFKSNQDEDLDKVLDYIKNRFKPDFLIDEKNGGLFAKTPGRPGPLSKAFVTVNPMLSPEEVRDRTVSSQDRDLVLALNSDSDYSLLRNRGRYTLVIATFSGNSIMQVGDKSDRAAMNKFNKSFGSNLDESAKEAWSLTEALRHASKAGYSQDFEAWLYHDRNRSYVTIGEFDSKGDPRIQTLATQFRAKAGRNPATGEEMLTPEYFTVPRNPSPGKPVDKMWIFDGTPRLMEVPDVRRKK